MRLFLKSRIEIPSRIDEQSKIVEVLSIDLLGLNSPVIAKAPPAGPFYPGHDKWNYDYSIVQRRPDLIADNWIRLGEFMMDKNEYRELDNGMYVRRDTTLVDVQALLEAFP